MTIKIGDRIIVVKNEPGNYVQSGSTGVVVSIRNNRIDTGLHIQIQYDKILDDEGNIEPRGKDDLKGKYFTKIERLALSNWKQTIEGE